MELSGFGFWHDSSNDGSASLSVQWEIRPYFCIPTTGNLSFHQANHKLPAKEDVVCILKNIKKRWHEQTRRENELTGLDKSVEHLGCIGCMRLEPGMDDMVVVPGSILPGWNQQERGLVTWGYDLRWSTQTIGNDQKHYSYSVGMGLN